MSLEFYQVTDESNRIHAINPANIQLLSNSAGNTKIQMIGTSITVMGGIAEVTKEIEEFFADTPKKTKKKKDEDK